MAGRRERKFVERRIAGDFAKIGEQFQISPLTARVIRNRGVEETEIGKYLYGTTADLHDPHLLKDADKAAEIIVSHIVKKKHIRVIGDYDIDGVMSSYILVKGLSDIGAHVSVQIPHRISDGYGLNVNLIEEAKSDSVDLIITCDNGISASEEIALAREYGMAVVVTDHHQVVNGIPNANAVVNPHQADCTYPFKNICGAMVAWKVLQVVYEKVGCKDSDALSFIENVAFATVGDIMPLKDENRIVVKAGLSAIRHTKNIGMAALIAQCGLSEREIKSYHFGFVLGPCINATGRLDTASRALELFLTEDREKAIQIASELVTLNEERKELTEQGIELAMQQYEAGDYEKDPIIVLYLPEVHESIAGIIAGRVREAYYKPTFILTKGENSAKGSARSIDEYSLAQEMGKCKELFLQFGGHPKAAGLSLEEEKIDLFRKTINELSPIRVEDEVEKVMLDACPPISYLTVEHVEELSILEPFGNENGGPLFGAKNMHVDRIVIMGKNRNVIKMQLHDENGYPATGISFANVEIFLDYLNQKFGEDAVQKAFQGDGNFKMNFIYVPTINDYNGKSVQLEIKYYI